MPLLKSLVDAEGRTLRADTPLRPAADCLFQIQAPRLFKAFSRSGEGALLLLANLADVDAVEGTWRISDAAGLADGDYAVCSPMTGMVSRLAFDQVMMRRLKRFGHDLLHITPVVGGAAVFGLKDKRNGLASVRDIRRDGPTLSLTARDGGTLLLWRDAAPKTVTIDDRAAAGRFAGNQLEVDLAEGPRAYRVVIS